MAGKKRKKAAADASAPKRVSLSVRDFALPVPRTGSIDAHSGYSQAREDGIEIHRRIQEERAEDHENYVAEATITHVFTHGGYEFEVSGRMDGFFDGSPPRIEEIKSTFSIRELSKRLTDDHPYVLQLRTYGYLHHLQQGVVPELSLLLVSTRNGETEERTLELNLEATEAWAKLRLQELAEEAERSEKRAARRRRIAEDFAFPFSTPRQGQRELVAQVAEGILSRKRMLMQAPTGLGKTAGILHPALQDALSRGQRVIYVTPKNSQHSVAEDAMDRFHDTGSPVKSLTLTAKSKICFKAEPLCNPDYCEYAKDYYGKVAREGLLDQLDRKRSLTARTFQELGEKHEVCPFELQLDAAAQADAVICDYNYVIAPRTSFGRISTSTIGQEGKPTLVIDEAHNLPSRAMDLYSPSLSSVSLEKMREAMGEIPKRFAREAGELIDGCIQTLLSCRPSGDSRASRIQAPREEFLEQDGKLRAFLSRYLESDVEIRPRDPVLRLCFYWSEFTAALEYVANPEVKEFFTTYHPHPTGGTVRITCCDPSALLRPCYDEFDHVIAFSATLKPFAYYAALSGLEGDDLLTAEFASPFERSHRKLLIIPQVSTKYSQRQKSAPRIAEAIHRISALRAGNYFAFFPSFEFMERVLEQFEPPAGFLVLRQSRDMKAAEIREILDHLRAAEEPTIVFAVQGGVFSEGVDYPGKAVIGAFVVGPPLPSFDLEREEMRKFYDQRYSLGFDFAYTFPAMAKAVQSAGRVIRTETDRGIIVLLDSRFLESSYAQSMPGDWFENSPRELVSTRILAEVEEFWRAGD